MVRKRAPKKLLSEEDFLNMMEKFAKHSGTTLIRTKARGGFSACVTFVSSVGVVSYSEKMPGFHEPGWASWCALRLLHPVALHYFENEIRQLFEFYKSGERNWITYNEEKRALLARYLQSPYKPGKRK